MNSLLNQKIWVDYNNTEYEEVVVCEDVDNLLSEIEDDAPVMYQGMEFFEDKSDNTMSVYIYDNDECYNFVLNEANL